MALKKNEKRLLMILGVAVAFFLFDRLVLSKKEDKAVPQAAQQIASVIPAPSAAKVRGTAVTASLNGKKQYETWGRDPFIDSRTVTPGTAKSTGKTGSKTALPVLKGLFWRDGKAYVMLDDEILKEGEEKKGLKIEKVEGKVVTCRQGNRSFTLFWSESL